MKNSNITHLDTDFSSPMHYLGSRLLTLPDVSGHMRIDHCWLNDIFELINSNGHGKKFNRAFEPFAGSASWTLAAMSIGLAHEYFINDSDEILIGAHRLIKEDPEKIKSVYAELANEYHKTLSSKDFFIDIIEQYNQEIDASIKSSLLPFIINYSWGGMLFHDARGKLVYREHNINEHHFPGYLEVANLTPEQFFSEVGRASKLYNENKVTYSSMDFQALFTGLTSHDFIMFNPPYPENVNENDGKSGMYCELYAREMLHNHLITCLNNIAATEVSYLMTYGYYDPAQDEYVIRDNLGKRTNYFQLKGYQGCSIGEVLDQTYISQSLKIPNSLSGKIIPASTLLKDEKLPVTKEVVQRFKAVTDKLNLETNA